VTEVLFVASSGTKFIPAVDPELVHVEPEGVYPFTVSRRDLQEFAEFTREAPTLEDLLREAAETAEVLGVGTAEAHILRALEWVQDEEGSEG